MVAGTNPTRCSSVLILLERRAAWSDPSPFDTNERAQTRNTAGQPRMFGRGNNRTDIFVSARCLLRDTARRWAANKNALRPQVILDFSPAPLLERRVT